MYARICIITVREGGGEFVLRFCRAHARARKAANAHAHAHAICSGNCNAVAAARIYAHERADSNERQATEAILGKRMATGSGHPSLHKARVVFFTIRAAALAPLLATPVGRTRFAGGISHS